MLKIAVLKSMKRDSCFTTGRIERNCQVDNIEKMYLKEIRIVRISFGEKHDSKILATLSSLLKIEVLNLACK